MSFKLEQYPETPDCLNKIKYFSLKYEKCTLLEINAVNRCKCNVELVSRVECLRTREEHKEVQYKK